MKQITQEQIEQAAEKLNLEKAPLSTTNYKLGAVDGIGWAISQMQEQWVPVTPETKLVPGKYYFALNRLPNGKLSKTIAVYTEGWDLEVEAEGDEEHLNHKEDHSYLPNGWYEECEQDGGSYDSFYFKRDVVYILDIALPELPRKEVEQNG